MYLLCPYNILYDISPLGKLILEKILLSLPLLILLLSCINLTYNLLDSYITIRAKGYLYKNKCDQIHPVVWYLSIQSSQQWNLSDYSNNDSFLGTLHHWFFKGSFSTPNNLSNSFHWPNLWYFWWTLSLFIVLLELTLTILF